MTRRQGQLTLSVPIARISEFMPNGIPMSFGAFCGSNEQRSQVVVRGTLPVLGKVGIVLLHADADLELRLAVRAASSGVPIVLMGRPCRPWMPSSPYSLLYGLDRAGVIRALRTGNDSQLIARVSDYLTVIDALREMDEDGRHFGKYPYSMELLSSLARLDCRTLEEGVLSRLPTKLGEELARRMTVAGDQQEVASLVESLSLRLCTTFGDVGGTTKAFGGTGTSVYATVAERGIASVFLPSRSDDVLDYIDAELDCLTRSGIRYMLILAGASVAGSPIARRLSVEQPRGTALFGVSADAAEEVASSPREIGAILGRLDRTFVFSCPTASAAAPFCEALGTYDRTILEQGHHWSREFLEILPRLEWGTSERTVKEQVVRPNDLVGHRFGALVLGRDLAAPVVVNRLYGRSQE